VETSITIAAQGAAQRNICGKRRLRSWRKVQRNMENVDYDRDARCSTPQHLQKASITIVT
jgi:hypothetical protein